MQKKNRRKHAFFYGTGKDIKTCVVAAVGMQSHKALFVFEWQGHILKMTSNNDLKAKKKMHVKLGVWVEALND